MTWFLALLLAAAPVFQPQSSPTDVPLIGLAAVDDSTAWAAGAKGTVLRTIDGGTTWQTLPVPGAEDLQFRDLHAVDANTVYALAIGPGAASRLYKTIDAGRTWTLLLTNPDEKGFYDAIAFFDSNRGLILGDPVDGSFVILRTEDGGKSWQRQPTPPALPNEGAFAASGTCLIVDGPHAWFATGGARVFHSKDQGRTWTVARTPIRNDAPTAGIFGLAASKGTLIAVGGDYKQPESDRNGAAISTDHGATWKLLTSPGGYRSAAAYTPDGTIVTVGVAGASYSEDTGRTWKNLDVPGYHSLALTPNGRGWAVGPEGRIARLTARSGLRRH